VQAQGLISIWLMDNYTHSTTATPEKFQSLSVCATWWEGHQSGDDAPTKGQKTREKSTFCQPYPAAPR